MTDYAFVGAFVLLVSVALLIPSLWRMRHGHDRNPLHRVRKWDD